MTAEIVTVERDVSVEEGGRIMRARNFRHLPVTDGGRLVGIISIRDLVAA